MTKNIYFASDFHFGYPDEVQSKEREKLVIKWLDDIKPSCKELYLLGDIFDFWFEYKYVAPQGNIRFLAKLTEFVESGIPVNIFCGNHDMWYGKYLEKEIGVSIFDEPIEREYFGKKTLHSSRTRSRKIRQRNEFFEWNIHKQNSTFSFCLYSCQLGIRIWASLVATQS